MTSSDLEKLLRSNGIENPESTIVGYELGLREGKDTSQDTKSCAGVVIAAITATIGLFSLIMYVLFETVKLSA